MTFLGFVQLLGWMLLGAWGVVVIVAGYLLADDLVKERRRNREIADLERAFEDE